MDRKVLQQLTKLSKSDKASINSEINSILSKYVLFHRFIEQTNDVVLPPVTFMGTVSLMGEDNLVKILDVHNSAVIPSLFLHSNIPFSLENFIKYFLEGPMIWGGAFSSIRQEKENNLICLVLRHRKNLAWSRVLGRGLCKLVGEHLHHFCDFEAKNRSVIIRISKNLSKD